MSDNETQGRTGIYWPHHPYFSSHENKALARVRADIKKSTAPNASQREVERMREFLWRMSSSYSYRTYGYYENYHASRVLSRWIRVFGS